MITSIVSREDSVYKAVPDLAMCDDGSLVCIYRESLFHLFHPFSRIALQTSRDGGLNWGPKFIVDECPDYEKDGGLNNPRILHLGEGRLILICDWIPPFEPENSPNTEILIWRSENRGETWSTREKTGIKGHICPCLFKTSTGTVIIGGDNNCLPVPGQVWTVNAFLSFDDGQTWEAPSPVASSDALWVNEGTFAELDDGSLICFMREDRERICGYKALSKDGGRTWEGPYRTELLVCIGRPHAGRLRSGEIAVTYGLGTSPRQLVLHAENQASAADPESALNVRKSHLEPKFRRFFIDHDRSIHPDGAYSSWVQLPSGDLFVVQYLVDDAPMAHIRSYLITRSDWLLCPEGELGHIIRYDPSAVNMHHYDRSKNVIYHEQALKIGADQYRKVHAGG